MASLCDKIKSDSSLDENPVKKLKLSDDADLSKDKRTVATMCGAWRPEEEDGGLIFVFKTRTPALSPDPTKECDYPENIEDFWEGSFVDTDIIQGFYSRFGSAPSLNVIWNLVVEKESINYFSVNIIDGAVLYYIQNTPEIRKKRLPLQNLN